MDIDIYNELIVAIVLRLMQMLDNGDLQWRQRILYNGFYKIHVRDWLSHNAYIRLLKMLESRNCGVVWIWQTASLSLNDLFYHISR